MVLTNYAPGNHLLFSAAKNFLGARAPRVFPRQKPDSSPFSQSHVDVLSTCRVHGVWKGSFLCLFPLLLGSDAGIPTFLSISYLKWVPIGGEKKSLLLSLYNAFNFSTEEFELEETKGQWTEIFDWEYMGEQITWEMKAVLVTQHDNKPCDVTICSDSNIFDCTETKAISSCRKKSYNKFLTGIFISPAFLKNYFKCWSLILR